MNDSTIPFNVIYSVTGEVGIITHAVGISLKLF